MSGSPPTFVTHVEAPALSVPADNRLWLDDVEVIAPGRPEPADPHPQNAIRTPQSGCGVGSEGDLELVSEDEILQRNVTPRAEGSKDAAEDEE